MTVRSVVCIVLFLLTDLGLVNRMYGQSSAFPAGLDQEIGYPKITQYLPDEYEGGVQVWDVVQDNDGTLYFANADEILMYDGLKWSHMPSSNQGVIRKLAMDEDRIWVGGVGEIGYLSPDQKGQLAYHSLQEKLDESQIQIENHVDQIYVIDSAIVFLVGNQILTYRNDQIFTEEYSRLGTFVKNSKLFFYRINEGLFVNSGGDSELLSDDPIFMDGGIFSMLPLPDDQIVVLTRKHGLHIFDGENCIPFNTAIDGQLSDARIYCATLIARKYIAIGTIVDGLFVLDLNGNLLHHFGPDLLPNAAVLRVRVTPDGNLWVLTNGGIARIDFPGAVTLYGEYNGVGKRVRKLSRFNGQLFAASSAGLLRLDRQDNTQQMHFKSIGPKEKIWDLLTYTDQLIVGYETRIAAYRDGGLMGIADGFQPSSFSVSDRDSNVVYIPNAQGLAYFQKEKSRLGTPIPIEEINTPTYQAMEMGATDLLLDPNRNYLLHMEHPLDSARRKITKIDSSFGFPVHETVDIHKLKGQIYLSADRDKEMYRLSKQLQVTKDSSLNQLVGFSKNMYVLLIDERENIWFSHWSDPTDHATSRYYVARKNQQGYTVDEILLNDYQEYLGFYPFVEDSVVWYHGIKQGLLRHDLGIPREIKDPVVKISKVIIGKDSILYGGFDQMLCTMGASLNYEKNRIRFEYVLPQYNRDFLPCYQVRLLGFDDQWSNCSETSFYDFSNLKEGSYEFQVRSSNSFGKLTTPATFSFSILPPWYRSWWAYLAYVLAGILATRGIVQWRSAQLRREKLALEGVVNERTAALQISNKKLEDQKTKLKVQAEKLRDIDQMKSRLFTNISHEFRTPLTLIKGPIDQLERDPEGQLSPTHIGMISRNTDRLLRLVNQLLDLAKLDAGTLPINATQGNVYQVIRLASTAFSSLAAERNLDYQIKIPSLPFWSFFDRGCLEKITYNLINNAFKFTPQEGSILVVADYDDGHLILEVRDTGIGVKPENQARIFERFYQVDDSLTRREEGSGIGLSLVKELVENMEGNIRLDSEFGRGSSFIVTIPLQKILAPLSNKEKLIKTLDQKLPISQMLHEFPDHTTASSRARVLVVEDNSDMRAYISEQLGPDYAVQSAVDGPEGLRLALQELPDLVVTDLMMPEMDGLQLCELLKSDERTSHIPVIILTAKAGLENKLAGLEIGADIYLTKPFDLRELQVNVQNLIEQRKRLREKFVQLDRFAPKDIEWPTLDQQFLSKLMDLFEEHHADADFSVPEMIEKLAMSKTQLHRKIKALTNSTPGAMLRNFRIKRAAQLLRKGESVTQTAYAVGFNNPSHFTRLFKEVHGVNPSEFV